MTIRQFSTGELSRLQSTQQSAMQDTCVLLTYSPASTDDYGWPNQAWAEGTIYDCGLEMMSRDEGMDETEVDQIDAKLRLPIAADTALTNVDRVRITKRYGVTLTTPMTFEIISGPMRGPSGLVLDLKLVTDGSDG